MGIVPSVTWFSRGHVVLIEIWSKRAFDLFHAHRRAFGVVLHLVAIDLAQAEVAGCPPLAGLFRKYRFYVAKVDSVSATASISPLW
jgi:hypothetical protein